MDFLALTAGFALPWALGAALLYAIDRPRACGGAAWRWGCGWFVGLFLQTLWMRALSAVGVPFGVASIGGPVALAALALGAWALRGTSDPRSGLRGSIATLAGATLPRWQRVVWLLLIAWLAIRFSLLLYEVAVRPLLPWDAWTQWATKARVWFAQKRIMPFVYADAWMAAASPEVYFDAAPHYPATVPLTQTWAALLLGRWDDALVNVPWWIHGVAFGLALFGLLRRLGFEPLAALVGTWLVLSLPLLETHIALAGYADLPMAAYYTLAAAAALSFGTGRRWQDALLAVLLALACVTIKNPGKAWVLTLLPAFAVAALPRHGLRVAGIGFAAVALAIAVLAQTQVSVLGYRLQGQFSMPWGALADAYLMMGNWNLLGYGVLAVAALGWRRLFAPPVAQYTVLVLAGMMFLLVGFSFTMAGAWVEDQSTVNRATLHLAPLLVVWMLVAFRAWRDATPVAPAA
jgi:hypothetical protein